MYCTSRGFRAGWHTWRHGQMTAHAGHDYAQQSLRTVEVAPRASQLTRSSGTVLSCVYWESPVCICLWLCMRVSSVRYPCFFVVAPCACRPYVGIVSNKHRSRSLIVARADAENYDHHTTATVGQPVPLRAGPAAHDAQRLLLSSQ